MDKKFLYEIRPVRIIRIPGRQPIRHACSMLLTKEEVLNYMEFGAVYRKPSNAIEPIRVTGENIDKLHVDNPDVSNLSLVLGKHIENSEINGFDNSKPVTDNDEIPGDEKDEKTSEENEIKNSVEEEYFVLGNNDETTVEVVEEPLPETKDMDCEEKSYDPAIEESQVVKETVDVEKKENHDQKQFSNNKGNGNKGNHNNFNGNIRVNTGNNHKNVKNK